MLKIKFGPAASALTILGFGIFAFLLNLGFWGTIVYVAYHFISKYW